ncbi:adenylosuccinate synthase [Halovivax gelatinilyticus]|uniref:adenylosuccinate synthase n=1 Tax=Halovivax gelatinilyticus TaxID=2961597 RepID=UPI0020CA7CC7|nr:adenylosuccinate synthase [Halovivax gelatinilyticus]
MNATIIGSQFGDEGKGGLVDVLAADADVVVRYQGGANAGHTVAHGEDTYKLRLIPSGVVQGAVGVLGNGCVVDLDTLFDEVDRLRERGLDPDVRVAACAHVVAPFHRFADRAAESAAADEEAIGTTGNGIGPAYEAKAGRYGIRVGDLVEPEHLRARVDAAVSRTRRVAEADFDAETTVNRGEAETTDDGGTATAIDTDDAFDPDPITDSLLTFGDRLESEGMIVDAGAFLTERHRAGETILFEGAQGTQIDVDFGTYPFVTSSNPTAGGAIVGTGVSPRAVADGHVVGVVKGYLSRVGNGPMPTEMDDERAATVRELVGGFGTVTGRPRRMGWLDLPMVRHAARVNGFTGLALTHVDTLAAFDEIRVCTAYELDGERVADVPSTIPAWERCEPVYESVETWSADDWGRIAESGYDALPDGARAFVAFLEDQLDVPVVAIGVGPGRDETIVRRNPLAGQQIDTEGRPT